MNSKAPEKTERLTALLGLAATDPGSADTCPSDEQLAAFIAHRLEGQARQKILIHLNRCPQCYHQWLEAASYLSENAESASERNLSQLLSRGWQRFTTWLTPWKLAVPAAAVVAMVCAVMWWPNSLDLDKQISADYATIADQNAVGLIRSLQDLPLPWENQALSFNGSDLSLPKKAFGAGLWAGRTALLGMDARSPLPDFLSPPNGLAWLETEWADYYQFGRWVMLLWALTRTEEPIGSWSQQQRILEELRDNLTKHPSSELEASQTLNTLERLQPLLAEVQRQADPSAQAHLNRRLEMIMQHLAPAK